MLNKLPSRLRPDTPTSFPVGGVHRYLGDTGLEKRVSRVEAPLCPNLRGSGEQVVDFGAELYCSILDRADDVTYANWEYSRSCMLGRNCYLVDHADCLLAVYNGEQRGRTAIMVKYARKLEREVVIIGPTSSCSYKNSYIRDSNNGG